MDDRYFFACFIYLVLASTFISLMPDSFFVGSSGTTPILTTEDIDGGISGIRKIATFIFVPFAISGIPAIFSLFIGLLNILCAIVGSIFIFEKVTQLIP